MDYGFTHAGKVYTPNGTPDIAPSDSDARNRAIEASELTAWAASPERQLAYFHFPAELTHTPGIPTPRKLYRADFYPMLANAMVKTWLGTPLGRITSARVYSHNFGSRMVTLTVLGTNGATYYGRASWDWGQCVTLRKVKTK